MLIFGFMLIVEMQIPLTIMITKRKNISFCLRKRGYTNNLQVALVRSLFQYKLQNLLLCILFYIVFDDVLSHQTSQIIDFTRFYFIVEASYFY